MNEENATLCKKVFFQDFLGEKLIREGGFGGGGAGYHMEKWVQNKNFDKSFNPDSRVKWGI